MCNVVLLVFVEECVLLSVHAQRGDDAKLYLSPSFGAHEDFDHTKLLEQLREHQTVLGATVMPGDVVTGLCIVEHEPADFCACFLLQTGHTSLRVRAAG